MKKKVILLAAVSCLTTSLTGCSKWYCDRPAFTIARAGTSMTAPAHDSVIGYDVPDTSGIRSKIMERIGRVEQNAQDTKGDCERSGKNVSRAVGEAQDSIAGNSRKVTQRVPESEIAY